VIQEDVVGEIVLKVYATPHVVVVTVGMKRHERSVQGPHDQIRIVTHHVLVEIL
jgi:hypothetical protein